MRLSLLRTDVEEVFDLAELPAAADERRLEPRRLERAARSRDDAEGPPQRDEPVLALQLEVTRFLVDDRLLGRATRRSADEHGSRLGDGLDPRRGVHEIAGDHALALRADRHGGLAGDDPGPGAKVGCADLVAERRDCGHEVERRANGSLGVVLGRGRGAPHRHYGIADELLDRPSVEPDQSAAGVEIARQQLAHIFRVARFGERREADQVGEQDRHQPALGRGLLRSGDGGRRRERSAALAAELRSRPVRRPARAAGAGKRNPTLGAELPTGLVLGAAARADVHVQSLRSTVVAALRAGPHLRKVDDRRGGGAHVRHAEPLASRVVVVPAGGEVRARQPFLGQP